MRITVDDIIRCVEPGGGRGVHKNGVYIALNNTFYSDDLLNIINDYNKKAEYYARRFIVVSNKELI